MRKFELCNKFHKHFPALNLEGYFGKAFSRDVYTLKVDDEVVLEEQTFDTCFRWVLREGNDDDIYHETYHNEHEPETVKSLRESDYVTK